MGYINTRMYTDVRGSMDGDGKVCHELPSQTNYPHCYRCAQCDCDIYLKYLSENDVERSWQSIRFISAHQTTAVKPIHWWALCTYTFPLAYSEPLPPTTDMEIFKTLNVYWLHEQTTALPLVMQPMRNLNEIWLWWCVGLVA